MKTSLLLVIILSYSLAGFSQYEIGVGLGSALITNKPHNVDLQSSFNGFFYVHREFRLSPRLIFEPTLNLASARYFMDGSFKEDANGKISFGITPTNYKQNRLSFTSIKMPLLLKYEWFSNSSGEGISIGIGPYLEYLVTAKQQFKIDETNYSENAPIDDRFHAGLAFDFGTSGAVLKKNRLGFGGGLQYQLTNYLKNNNPSFKPLVFYLRVGYRF